MIRWPWWSRYVPVYAPNSLMVALGDQNGENGPENGAQGQPEAYTSTAADQECAKW